MNPKSIIRLCISLVLLLCAAVLSLQKFEYAKTGHLSQLSIQASPASKHALCSHSSCNHGKIIGSAKHSDTGGSKVPMSSEEAPAPDQSVSPGLEELRAAYSPMGPSEGEPLQSYSPRPDGKAQSGRRLAIDVDSLAQTLQTVVEGDQLQLALPDGRKDRAIVNLVLEDNSNWVRVGGSLSDGGSFSLATDGRNAGGIIRLPKQQLAVEIVQEDDGKVFLVERHLDDVVCKAIPLPNDSNEPMFAQHSEITERTSVPVLSSRPSARAVIYLDFDGEVVQDPSWQAGRRIDAPPARLSSAQIVEVFNRVKEDFWAFDIDVTTNVNRYNSAPVGRRMRCIITKNDTAAPGAGGVAYLNSFRRAGSSYSSNIPCWVFADNHAKYCADAISHEVGHTFGLRHDGRTSPNEDYYKGHGSGPTGWAPIMGVGYYQSLVQWSKGEYRNANNFEDDIAMIASAENGVGFVLDDAGNTTATAAPLPMQAGRVDSSGIISQQTDADVYRFQTTGGTLSLQASPVAVDPNVDIKFELLNFAGQVVAFSNPQEQLNASISQNLASGVYFLRISGSGKLDPLATGYTSYGCIGAYSISGIVPGAPISTVSAPVFSPGSGTHSGPIQVAMSTATFGATIRYTINGTGPTETSTSYTGPITVSSNTTIRARAFASGMSPSAVSEAAYTMLSTASAPVFRPASGIYSGPLSVTIGTSTPGATIRYTTNGTDPTAASTAYTGPIYISATTTVRARAFAAGMNPSTVNAATYTINRTALAPVFSPGSGIYSGPLSVTIGTSTPGATIRYTTNGTDPTATSTAYTGPISVSATTTVLARAFAAGMNPSTVIAATYTINRTASAPVFSPSSGTYRGPIRVTFGTSTPGATIRYTTNGTDPTAASTAYTGPIYISATTTVRARTFAPGMNPSTVNAATFLIR